MKSSESDDGGGWRWEPLWSAGESPSGEGRLWGLRRPRESTQTMRPGDFSPAQRVVRGEEGAWIDLRLGFGQTNAVEGRWDGAQRRWAGCRHSCGERVGRMRDCKSLVSVGRGERTSWSKSRVFESKISEVEHF